MIEFNMNVGWLIYFIVSITALFINGHIDLMNETNHRIDYEKYHEIRRKLNDVKCILWFQFILGFLIYVWFYCHVALTIRIG